jgi:hypothetical protein
MIERPPLVENRVRRIQGGFAFIEHRFLRDRFWHCLSHHELLLYFFLILAADRNGLSFYGFDKICSILEISLDHFIEARDRLIQKDLLAFDGRMFQVLSLPENPIAKPKTPLRPGEEMAEKDPATIRRLIVESLRGGK